MMAARTRPCGCKSVPVRTGERGSLGLRSAEAGDLSGKLARGRPALCRSAGWLQNQPVLTPSCPRVHTHFTCIHQLSSGPHFTLSHNTLTVFPRCSNRCEVAPVAVKQNSSGQTFHKIRTAKYASPTLYSRCCYLTYRALCRTILGTVSMRQLDGGKRTRTSIGILGIRRTERTRERKS